MCLILMILVAVSGMYTARKGTNNFFSQEGKVLLLTAFLAAFSLTMAITGQDQKCSNEGEHVYVPLTANDPCYKCYCRQGRVECELNECPSLEGCHAILFNRPRGHCCNVCKGCSVNRLDLASGDVWPSPEDPCIIMMCQAGVVTTSREICAPPCQNPVTVPGQCCPSCSGCYHNGIDYQNGEKFTLKQDSSVQCVCKAGNVTCSRQACPVLNCPSEKIYEERGEKCPKCKDHRMVFDTPRSCFFSRRVFNDGDVHITDACTFCVCERGTMLCERLQCPVINCSFKEQKTEPGSCCPSCIFKLSCAVGDVRKKDNETWRKDKCTTCVCKSGTVHCEHRKCQQTDSACPQGYQAMYQKDQCCPVCTKNPGICSLRGQSSNQIVTFDGAKYATEGFCTHDLVRDCGQGQIIVKAKYKTKSNLSKHIDLVTIRFGSTRIKLYRTSGIRINRTSLFSTQFTSNDFSLKIRPSRINVTVKLGLSVSWNMNDRLSVKVGGDLFQSGRLCGLCGNFDGDLQNELVNRHGGQVVDSNLMMQFWVRGKQCRSYLAEADDTIKSFRKRSLFSPRNYGRKRKGSSSRKK